MFIKPLTTPYHLLQYEAYARRLLPGPLKEEIERQLRNYRAGFNGEKSLEPAFGALPDKDYWIFHDLRLSNNFYYFQIDFLILTLTYCLIVEVKNIAGTLGLDFATHNLTRKFNGKYENFQDPTVQSTALRQQFQDWLALHCDYLPEMPVDDLVVFSPPGTYINFFNGTNEQMQKIVRGPLLKKKILSLAEHYPQRLTSAKSLKLLSKQLLSSHHPKKINLIHDGTLAASDILSGVQCPSCGHIPMMRTHLNWRCPACGQASPKAYRAALNDYRLIYGPEITNKQCKEFLTLDSMVTSRYLLQSMSPKSIGKTSDRSYCLTGNPPQKEF